MDSIPNFSSRQLLKEESSLILPSLEVSDALEIGEITRFKGVKRKLPVAIEVRLCDWIVYHASLPGSKPENDWWMERKSRVVMLKHHSTLSNLYLSNHS